MERVIAKYEFNDAEGLLQALGEALDGEKGCLIVESPDSWYFTGFEVVETRMSDGGTDRKIRLIEGKRPE
jgi:hypothetical protein